MAHLESTTKDPEQDRQVVPRLGPHGAGDADGQAVLGLARDILDKDGAQEVADDLGPQGLVVAGGDEHLRAGGGGAGGVKGIAEVAGQALGRAQSQVAGGRVGVVDAAKLLDAAAHGADDGVGGGEDDGRVGGGGGAVLDGCCWLWGWARLGQG